jgi:hypothetical protein
MISSVGRAMKSLTTNHDSMVQQYQGTFEQLLKAFQDESVRYTEITVIGMSTMTEMMLSELKDECMPFRSSMCP